jgi:8-oxo-dGTP pyrophosphatase MutT (NUDIX family)
VSAAKGLISAGTVIIDPSGRVLLRRPTNGYGGYAWTFAKGRVDSGESFEATAARETKEETGWACEIGAAIGDFVGDTSVTRFFLATPLVFVSAPDPDETEATAWVSRDDAEALIRRSSTAIGRARDLAVLSAAYEVLKPSALMN